MIDQILGELAGSASMCWEPKPKGVFDSTTCKKFVDEARSKISPITALREALKDEGYRLGWIANLAMSFKDEGCEHEIAQRGAERFLQLLESQNT